jgi:hypothetical protein
MILTDLVVVLLWIDVSTCCLTHAADCSRNRWAMPWSLSLTVTTRSLYAVTVDWFVVEVLGGAGGGMGGEPLACAATWAQDTAVLRPLLKLAAFTGVVLSPTEFLIIDRSL